MAEKLPWDKLLEQALTAPGSLTGVYDRFHDYSITNMMLFLMQGIFEPVASESRWKSLGRMKRIDARRKTSHRTPVRKRARSRTCTRR